jgi:hypothetical protein
LGRNAPDDYDTDYFRTLSCDGGVRPRQCSDRHIKACAVDHPPWYCETDDGGKPFCRCGVNSIQMPEEVDDTFDHPDFKRIKCSEERVLPAEEWTGDDDDPRPPPRPLAGGPRTAAEPPRVSDMPRSDRPQRGKEHSGWIDARLADLVPVRSADAGRAGPPQTPFDPPRAPDLSWRPRPTRPNVVVADRPMGRRVNFPLSLPQSRQRSASTAIGRTQSAPQLRAPVRVPWR